MASEGWQPERRRRPRGLVVVLVKSRAHGPLREGASDGRRLSEDSNPLWVDSWVAGGFLGLGLGKIYPFPNSFLDFFMDPSPRVHDSLESCPFILNFFSFLVSVLDPTVNDVLGLEMGTTLRPIVSRCRSRIWCPYP